MARLGTTSCQALNDVLERELQIKLTFLAKEHLLEEKRITAEIREAQTDLTRLEYEKLKYFKGYNPALEKTRKVQKICSRCPSEDFGYLLAQAKKRNQDTEKAAKGSTQKTTMPRFSTMVEKSYLPNPHARNAIEFSIMDQSSSKKASTSPDVIEL